MSTAAPPFDPYREWLGIEPREQPADFYRLLGLARFETDLGRIATAADQRMALVRSFQTGPRGIYTQRLLNELSTARIALLSPASKALYDQALSQHLAARMTPVAMQTSMYSEPTILTFGVGQSAPAAPPVLPPAPPDGLRLPLQIDAADDDESPEVIKPQAWWRPLVTLIGVPLVVLAAVVAWGLGRSYFFNGNANDMGDAAASVGEGAEPSSPPTRSQPPPKPVLLLQEGSGEVVFSPATARRSGAVELQVVGTEEVLANWTTPEDAARWHFKLVKPGFFQAEVIYATGPDTKGAGLEFVIGDRTAAIDLRSSGGLDQFITDSKPLFVSTSGEQTLIVRPIRQPAGDWLVLRNVRLIPADRPQPTTGEAPQP